MKHRRRFSAWLDSIDPDIRKAVIDPKSWLGVTTIVAALVAVTGWLPGSVDLFHLRVIPAVLIYLPTLILGLTLGTLERQGRLSLFAFGLGCLAGSLVFQVFMWSLVALSDLPGAAVMASLPILLASYHGSVFRSGPETPYIAVGTILAIGGAVLISNDAAHLAIYAAAGPVAVGSALLLGRNSVFNHRSRIQSVALRDAVDAQILSERARHVEVMSVALGRLQGSSHDAGNALSGALFNLEQLALEVRRPVTDLRSERIGTIAVDIMSSLERLKRLLGEARETSQESRPALERIDAPRCVREVLDDVGRRFPEVALAFNVQGDAGLASVRVCGGEMSLNRILTNLVVNACEGSGQATPSQVSVLLSPDPKDDCTYLTIADDGPGFSATMLAAPFRGFHTTKSGGTGLGLYTAERLVRASGGLLAIANPPDGTSGARVHLTLRR